MFTNVEDRHQAELVCELGLIHPATPVGNYRPHPMAARYEGPAPVQAHDSLAAVQQEYEGPEWAQAIARDAIRSEAHEKLIVRLCRVIDTAIGDSHLVEDDRAVSPEDHAGYAIERDEAKAVRDAVIDALRNTVRGTELSPQEVGALHLKARKEAETRFPKHMRSGMQFGKRWAFIEGAKWQASQ